MNLDSLVSRGMRPWQPTNEAHDVDAWHQYECPMAGTYKLPGDHQVLFTLIGDTADRLSVWAYLPISDADQAKVDEAAFATPTEMREFIEDLFASREATFALARDLQVWRWTRSTVSSEDGLIPTATDALAAMVKDITDKQDPPGPDVLFRAELAEAEVTTDDDLVDA
jgi:hypothetical protein